MDSLEKADRFAVIFGVLTLLLSFAIYLLPLPRTILPFLMVLLPALVAIGLTALSEGQSGVRSLLSKLGLTASSLTPAGDDE